MSQVRADTIAVSRYGGFHHQFDRPLPVRIVRRPQPDPANRPERAEPVVVRRDLPYLGRFLDIYA